MIKGSQGRDPAQMRAAFDDVCAGFPPALHHFFLEAFRDPGGCGVVGGVARCSVLWLVGWICVVRLERWKGRARLQRHGVRRQHVWLLLQLLHPPVPGRGTSHPHACTHPHNGPMPPRRHLV